MATQLSNAQKKEWALTLFLQNDLNQKEIAKKVAISEVSLSRWVKEGEWESRRKSLLTTKEEQLVHLYNLLDRVSKKLKEADSIGDTKIADMYSKYTAAIKNLETETSTAQIVEVGRMYVKWLKELDAAFALTTAEHLDKFIKARLKRF